jgi:alkylhydroperoxidase family enzyme
VTKAAKDWKTEGLNSTDEALCAFGEKRTQTTDSMLKKDIRQLEDLGFTHTAVHDAVQVIGYFNYINRVAEAFHVDLEVYLRAWVK